MNQSVDSRWPEIDAESGSEVSFDNFTLVTTVEEGWSNLCDPNLWTALPEPELNSLSAVFVGVWV